MEGQGLLGRRYHSKKASEGHASGHSQVSCETLDTVQEEIPQEESVKHMEAALAAEKILEEVERKQKQDAAELRKQELLRSIEAKLKADEEANQKANEELRQMHRQLQLQEEMAEEAAAKEAAEAGKEKEPELLKAVKLEPADEDWIEEVKELSSLRMCNLCNTKNYLRQGLCCNLYCQAFYMRDPHAGEN